MYDFPCRRVRNITEEADIADGLMPTADEMFSDAAPSNWDKHALRSSFRAHLDWQSPPVFLHLLLRFKWLSEENSKQSWNTGWQNP
jgi:hypothetical protein